VEIIIAVAEIIIAALITGTVEIIIAAAVMIIATWRKFKKRFNSGKKIIPEKYNDDTFQPP
jgi:hypothetical protein